MSLDLFVLQTLNGLSFGALLFLLASGFTLVYGLMRIVNLAHGALYLVGGYVGVVVMADDGFVPAGHRRGHRGRGRYRPGHGAPAAAAGERSGAAGGAADGGHRARHRRPVIWPSSVARRSSCPCPRNCQVPPLSDRSPIPGYRLFVMVVACRGGRAAVPGPAADAPRRPHPGGRGRPGDRVGDGHRHRPPVRGHVRARCRPSLVWLV